MPGPPQTVYTLSELCAAARVSARTVRYYIAQQLVPAPRMRGPATRYGKNHLLRIMAVKLLRKRRVPVPMIRTQMSKLSLDDIEALLAQENAGPVAAASPPTAPTLPPTVPPVEALGESWMSVPLLPGLELRVRQPASELQGRLAEEIVARYRIHPANAGRSDG